MSEINKKLGFANVKRELLKKRSPEERRSGFGPIYYSFKPEEAQEQSSRCIKCPVDIYKDMSGEFSFCRTGCPLGNKIPLWLEAIKQNDIKTAFELSNETSPMPEVLGAVCPHDQLCQGACTVGRTEHGSVVIGYNEVYLNEEAFKMGLKPDFGENVPKIGKKVAVIGSGPAGIGCATFLMRGGVEVHMFEKADKPGGLMTYGIPNFKFDKEKVMLRRFKWMEDAGLKLFLNTPIETEEQIKEMLDEYDAIFIGVGAPNGKSARMKNEDANGVHQVMEILTYAQKGVFENFYGDLLKDKKVVVLGGGDSAMDGVRVSVRLGAKNVTCAYRRDADNMPGSPKERVNAEEEGVEFQYYTSPKEVLVDENNNVIGLKCEKTELGEPGSDGRRRLQVIEGSDFTIDCDVIILALGFDNNHFPWYDTAEVNVGPWGDIIIDKDCRTSNRRVFAGGDAVRGADLAVTAARDGRDAAYAMLKDFGVEVNK